MLTSIIVRIIFQPEGSEHNILETKLQLVLDPESFVALESIQEPEKCVGVEDNGSMKAAENCTSSDNHAMFGIHLIVRLRHICCYFIFAWDFSLAMKAIARLMFPRQQQFSDAKRSTYRYSYNTLDFVEKKGI